MSDPLRLLDAQRKSRELSYVSVVVSSHPSQLRFCRVICCSGVSGSAACDDGVAINYLHVCSRTSPLRIETVRH